MKKFSIDSAEQTRLNGVKNNATENAVPEAIETYMVPKNILFEQLLKALDAPSDTCTNVTTTLPANVYELIKVNKLQVRYLIMRGIMLEQLIRQKDARIREEADIKEYWKKRYLELKGAEKHD